MYCKYEYGGRFVLTLLVTWKQKYFAFEEWIQFRKYLIAWHLFRELCDKSRFKQLLQISFHNFTRTMFCVQSYSNFYSTNFHYYWLSWLTRESRKNLQQFLLPLPNSIYNFTTWEFKISSDICQSSSRLILLARSYNRAIIEGSKINSRMSTSEFSQTASLKFIVL